MSTAPDDRSQDPPDVVPAPPTEAVVPAEAEAEDDDDEDYSWVGHDDPDDRESEWWWERFHGR